METFEDEARCGTDDDVKRQATPADASLSGICLPILVCADTCDYHQSPAHHLSPVTFGDRPIVARAGTTIAKNRHRLCGRTPATNAWVRRDATIHSRERWILRVDKARSRPPPFAKSTFFDRKSVIADHVTVWSRSDTIESLSAVFTKR
jgi:hypothetical protein